VIVLALEAALGRFSAAIGTDGKAAASAELPANLALERGLREVDRLIRSASLRPSDVDRIGVGIGPGGFTGTRIAISFAKSLAQGWNRPLVGVNSFDAIEAGLPPSESALTVVRARREVISVRYRTAQGTRRYSGYIADVIEQLGAEGVPAGLVPVTGDTQDVIAALAERGWSVKPVAPAYTPAAVAVALIAGEREPARSFHEVRADYGELPAAKVPTQTRPERRFK
jgi:tRNA threonylcarbamoyladenosine biosynthesis protein TsaB